MRILVALLVALSASACVAASRGDSLAGRYELVSVNGRAVPAPSGEESEVLVERGSLTLGADGRYEIEIAASHVETQVRVVRGRYAVEQDEIAMRPDAGQGEEPVRFRFTREGRRLRLVTAENDVYVWRWR